MDIGQIPTRNAAPDDTVHACIGCEGEFNADIDGEFVDGEYLCKSCLETKEES